MEPSQEVRPGRRPPATPDDEKRHIRLIRSALKKRQSLQEQLEEQNNLIAQRCYEAMNDGVQTQKVAQELGVTRQALYKTVRERVRGVPITERLGGKNGRK